jgi:PadR family transcriptional regulator, regulatory protein AphA
MVFPPNPRISSGTEDKLVAMSPQAIAPKRLGTTAYAVLGLLSLRDWTTYELAQQMDRGVGRMWGASASMVYEEPKHLVSYGYATVTDTPVGRRPRVRYSITEAGRQALAEWLATEPTPLTLQFEGLLKVLFADQGPAGTNHEILNAVRQWAAEASANASEKATGYLDGDYIVGVPFSERAVIVAQTLAFLAEFYSLIERWSSWASDLADAGDGLERAKATFAAIAAGRSPLSRR